MNIEVSRKENMLWGQALGGMQQWYVAEDCRESPVGRITKVRKMEG